MDSSAVKRLKKTSLIWGKFSETRSLHYIRLAVLTHNLNGYCSTNLRLQRVIIFALLPPSNLSGEFFFFFFEKKKIIKRSFCQMSNILFFFFRLLAHASSYYDLGSFPDSGMNRALEKLKRRDLFSGEDGGRKVKKKKKVPQDN